MRLGLRSSVLAFALVCNAGLVHSAPPEQAPEIDTSGKGAVLCVWHIYLTMKAVGDACFADDQTSARETLDWAIREIEGFILKNSDITPEKLRAGKQKIITSTVNFRGREKLCERSDRNTSIRLYEWLGSRSPAEVRANILDVLSVPRKPVMNPCL